jgi:hypothetical protein
VLVAELDEDDVVADDDEDDEFVDDEVDDDESLEGDEDVEGASAFLPPSPFAGAVPFPPARESFR